MDGERTEWLISSFDESVTIISARDASTSENKDKNLEDAHAKKASLIPTDNLILEVTRLLTNS